MTNLDHVLALQALVRRWHGRPWAAFCAEHVGADADPDEVYAVEVRTEHGAYHGRPHARTGAVHIVMGPIPDHLKVERLH